MSTEPKAEKVENSKKRRNKQRRNKYIKMSNVKTKMRRKSDKLEYYANMPSQSTRLRLFPLTNPTVCDPGRKNTC